MGYLSLFTFEGYSDYVRRLGQWHLSKTNRSNGRTLCGTPMLSPNRATYMPFEERVKCAKCFELAGMPLSEEEKAKDPWK